MAHSATSWTNSGTCGGVDSCGTSTSTGKPPKTSETSYIWNRICSCRRSLGEQTLIPRLGRGSNVCDTSLQAYLPMSLLRNFRCVSTHEEDLGHAGFWRLVSAGEGGHREEFRSGAFDEAIKSDFTWLPAEDGAVVPYRPWRYLAYYVLPLSPSCHSDPFVGILWFGRQSHCAVLYVP